MGRLGRPAHPPADLVELGQAELVGAVDDQGVGPGDVEAGLDDAGRDQHVGLAPDEGQHDLLELALAHLAVGHQRRRISGTSSRTRSAASSMVSTRLCRKKLCPPRARSRRRASTTRSSSYSPTWVAIGRRPGGGVSITLMSRSPESDIWSVRGMGVARHGQHVGAHPELAQGLLLGHAEALLLVHDDQPQVLRLHVHAEQPVGADEDVELAVAVAAQHLARLGRRAEAVDHVHADREVLEALAERPQVLLGQEGGGHQHQHLLARRPRPGTPRAARSRSCRSRRRRTPAGPSAACAPCRRPRRRSRAAGRGSRGRGSAARSPASTRPPAGRRSPRPAPAPRRAR